MQQTTYKNTTFSELQKLFIESCIELCDPRSLDSYRARVAGPVYILQELYKVIDDWKKAKLKSFETLSSCRDEAISIVNDDICIDYGRISKKSFIDILSSIKDQKENLENNLPKAEYYIYYILTVNKNYIKTLLESLDSLINTSCTTPEQVKSVSQNVITNTGFLITELINYGFAKGFINRLIKAVFVFNPESTFKDCWAAFYGRVLSQDKDKYAVVFKAYIPENQLEKVSIPELKKTISEIEVDKIDVLRGIGKFKKFFQEQSAQRFMIKEVNALDHYQALKIAKSELGIMLDLMHLGYCNLRIDLRETALVINHNQPDKADFSNNSLPNR